MLPDNQLRRLQEALSHQRAGRFTEAIRLYNRILQKTPSNFDCVNALAGLYAQLGDVNSATPLFRRAAKLRPDLADTHYNLAVALSMSGHHGEAAGHYKQTLDRNPRHANARNNYAATLLQQGQIAAALQQYDELIAINPALADAYNNRGMALQNLKRLQEAVADYDKAIALRPNFPEAHVNRGNALQGLRRFNDALASFEKAIAQKPDFADAYGNAGNIHCQLGQHKEALNTYEHALSLQPGDSEIKSMRLYAKMHLCDWSNFDAECADLISCVERGLPIHTFVTLAISSSHELQLRCARLFSETKFPPSDKPVWRGEVYAHDRIRVAYVSGEFREHATGYLLPGLFEHHDRSRFEVTGISLGSEEESPTRRRIKNAFERFVHVRDKSDQDIAALLRELEIDIAVDLMGYTQNARPGIFTLRPAPVQVSYLGYLGPMGADFVDYVIADKIALPFDQQPYYAETIAHLPDCFLVNDDRLTISPRTPTRAEVGLPDEGFVFSSFNNSYKIGRPMFELWMRLLRAVDGSVLWLFEANAEMALNLRCEAQRCGVDPSRIVFAPRVGLPEHLARQQLADLFLDSSPYNAGATGAAALWAGVPLLTMIGSTFVGRMAASMLHAVGLPELVTESLSGYEALALKVAGEPDFCAVLRERLARNRKTHPLFDTERFTRNIEAAYETMVDLSRRGERPRSFSVAEQGAAKA